MKTAKELFERLRTDEAFATEFTEALQSKRKAGAKNYYETMIPAANERGYELTAKDIDELINSHDSELSPEELGKVAGGTSACIPLTVVLSVGAVILTGTATISIVAEATQGD